MNAASLIPTAPESLCTMVRKAVFRSHDVQEDDLARENRLSAHCYSCGEPKSERRGVDCAAKAVHS